MVVLLLPVTAKLAPIVAVVPILLVTGVISGYTNRYHNIRINSLRAEYLQINFKEKNINK